MMLMFSAAASRVAASEKDVGSIVLPADHNAVVTADCQAVVSATDAIYQVELRDPGDRSVELSSNFNALFMKRDVVYDSRIQAKAIEGKAGLGAKLPAIRSCALSNGDVTDFNFFRNRQCTSIKDTRYDVTQRVISTSNGGSGY